MVGVGAGPLAGTLEAAGTGTQISVALQPTSIVADGASTTQATATVLDASNTGVPGDTVTFSPTPVGGQGAVIDNQDGTYTATIQSSTGAGPVTVTATDGTSGGISAGAQLTQTPGAVTVTGPATVEL